MANLRLPFDRPDALVALRVRLCRCTHRHGDGRREFGDKLHTDTQITFHSAGCYLPLALAYVHILGLSLISGLPHPYYRGHAHEHEQEHDMHMHMSHAHAHVHAHVRVGELYACDVVIRRRADVLMRLEFGTHES
jgi:hypothetical protein